MTLQDFAADETLRATIRRLQQQLAQAKQRNEELAEVTIQACKDAVLALGPLKPVHAPTHRDRRQGEGEVALWDMGDWQGAKRTPSYNTQVMIQRVEQFWSIAERFTNILRADHPIRSATLIFGGDMIEGLFQFPTQPFEIDSTLFDQYVNVSELITRTVRQALSIYDRVTVVSEWGNHGRIGSKRDAVPRSDNFDRMCYEFARRLLQNEKRLTWPDCSEDIQHLEIGNYRALVVHGDEVGRMGYASRNTFINHCNRWKAGAHSWDFRDVYCHHYHQDAEEPMANGEGKIYWTGSTESDNRYANIMLASDAQPSQRLHFVHPVKGYVTSRHQVYLT